MSRGKPSLLDEVGDAASGAGSEALAAISNFGGGDAGGTVGRLVSTVFGRHGGFAPKVITTVTKHGIAGIERVEPLPGVDRGYRAVAADANGLESIRTIIELDPREYDVTVTREEGAGVVEFVQLPEPETEATVEPSPPVSEADSGGSAGASARPNAGERAETDTIRTGGTRRDEVAEARAEAEKAKAEAEAEKARAEAETAQAEAEAAKARARAERARAESQAAGVRERTPELDGDAAIGSEHLATNDAGERRVAATRADPADERHAAEPVGAASVADVDPAFQSLSREEDAAGSADRPGTGEGVEQAGAAPSADTPTAPESTGQFRGADHGTNAASDDAGKWGLPDDDGETVDDEFGSFVAADPVAEPDAAAENEQRNAGGASTDEGIGRWAGDATGESNGPEETGGFEF